MAGHEDAVHCVVIAPNGKIAMSGSRDKTIRTWCMVNFAALTVSTGHVDSVTCLAVTYDSRFLISGSSDCSIRIWNINERI